MNYDNVNIGPLEVNKDQYLEDAVERLLPSEARAAEAWTITVTAGWGLYVLPVVEGLLGLVLASLAITGFTGLLRSES